MIQVKDQTPSNCKSHLNLTHENEHGEEENLEFQNSLCENNVVALTPVLPSPRKESVGLATRKR